MLADQIEKAYRSYTIWDLDGVESKPIVTTQPKLIANGRAVKCQKVEESIWPFWCFAIKQAVKVSESRRSSDLLTSRYSKP